MAFIDKHSAMNRVDVWKADNMKASKHFGRYLSLSWREKMADHIYKSKMMQEKAKICKFLPNSYNWDVFGPKSVFLPAYMWYAYDNVRQDAREAVLLARVCACAAVSLARTKGMVKTAAEDHYWGVKFSFYFFSRPGFGYFFRGFLKGQPKGTERVIFLQLFNKLWAGNLQVSWPHLQTGKRNTLLALSKWRSFSRDMAAHG